jgi:hypothetical protein
LLARPRTWTVGDTHAGGGLADTGGEAVAEGVEAVGDAFLGVGVHDGDGGGQRVGLGAVGGGEQEDAFVPGAQAAAFHELAPAGQRGDGEAVAEGLAEGGQVRCHAVDALGAVLGPAETGDHLVEHEHGAVAGGQLADALEVAGGGLGLGGRLHDDAGDRVLVEERGEGVEVAVGEGGGGLVGDAGVHGGAADEPVVGGEERLVTAQGDEGAAGGRPRQAHGGRGGVGAVLGELDHLRGGHGLQEALGGLDLDGGGADEVAAAVELPTHGLGDAGVGVAEGDRAQAGPVLDVLVTVDVPHVRAPAVRDDRRQVLGVLVVALGVGVGTARDHGVQPLVQRGRLRQGRDGERHAGTFVVGGHPGHDGPTAAGPEHR